MHQSIEQSKMLKRGLPLNLFRFLTFSFTSDLECGLIVRSSRIFFLCPYPSERSGYWVSQLEAEMDFKSYIKHLLNITNIFMVDFITLRVDH